MKPACGIKTIQGAIGWASLVTAMYVVINLLLGAKNFYDSCTMGGVCTKQMLHISGAIVGALLFLAIVYRIIRQPLIACFPVACGHRRSIFTGRSSKPLPEILLSVDRELPTEEKLQEFEEKARCYLNDIKAPLEKAMKETTFGYILSGSAVERYGIPLMMLDQRGNTCCSSSSRNIAALYTDLDVMFCSSVHRASFNGHGNILVEPLVVEGKGFTGYARLKTSTLGYERACFSSRLIREQTKNAVSYASVSGLPGVTCCCGTTELTPMIKLYSKGPAVKIIIFGLFEADITPCIHCSEWPPLSDWASRPRYWPSALDAQRIMSLGCHLVAKSAPEDKKERSWRFSFSLAEVELSKLVPTAARKCFLALKIILKDHLQPVVPEITSYQMKTIFLNTLERVPVGFWVEENIEECFMTLLAEVRDALLSTNCPHHWFSFINLFNIEDNRLQLLGKKVERIMKDPAPFILDDGCCCLSSCCVRVPDYTFTRRSSEQFIADYEEVTISADGHMLDDSGSQRHQLLVSPSQKPEDSLHSNSYPSESHIQGATAGPKQLVVSLPLDIQVAEPETSFYVDEAEDDSLRNTFSLVVCLPPEQSA